jgi:phosphatidate phosphatase APP1
VKKRRSPLRALLARARDPVMIMPYLGFGTARRLSICGRVLQDEGFRAAGAPERRLANLVAFFKRLESDEVPGARLVADSSGRPVETTSDREGYFHAELRRRGKPGWNAVEVQLKRDPSVRATCEALVPSPAAKFGVISDIDDTVVWSDALHKARMLLIVAFSSARTRKPFKGAAAFYRALHDGVNPVFYVSKSPWNLYAPLSEFLELQGFPRGPLLLRDFGLRMRRNHKREAIEKILRAYPRLKFILIGDSGEQDPEIYADVVRRHAKRVRVIYIRSVDPDPARIAAIEKLVALLATTGCQLVLAPDSELAAAHAAAEGLIQPSHLREIRSDARADQASEASMLSNAAASIGSLK